MRAESLLPGLVFLPQLYVMNVGLAAGSLGLALAPLAVGIAGTVPRGRVIRIGVLILLLLAGQMALGLEFFHALHDDFFWNPHELGLAERLTPHMLSYGPTPYWVWGIHVVAVGLFSIIITAAGRAQGGGGLKALGWFVGGSFLLMTAVWALYDRYLLMLIPALIVLSLMNRKLARPSLIIALLAGFGLLSFAYARDHLAYNAARWKAVDYLDTAGLAKRDTQGGWVIDGWFLYACAENAELDAKGNVLVRGVTTDEPVRYEISNRPTPGTQVLFEAPYERWLGRSGSVYVLDLEGG